MTTPGDNYVDKHRGDPELAVQAELIRGSFNVLKRVHLSRSVESGY